MSPVRGWLPESPCGRQCLPRSGSLPSVGVVRRILRLLVVVVLLCCGFSLGCASPLLPRGIRGCAARRWFAGLLAGFGVELRVRGDTSFPGGGVGTLVVANHVSWLDVLALQAVRPMRMLAKSELRSWPLLGTFAVRSGTLFIERDRLRCLPAAVDRITGALDEGSVVGVFPEGTTWCGRASGQYRPAVFQAALDANAQVRPAVLRYRVGGQPTTAAAFVGDDTLLRSVVSVLGARGLVVELELLPPFPARQTRSPSTEREVSGGTGGRARRELALRCARAAGAVAPERSARAGWTSSGGEVAGFPGERFDRSESHPRVAPPAQEEFTVDSAVP
ncbi:MULTISPECIES: lysophospholipid acyltransferase family protein [Actinopolyspora]|uniref:1-acyl-sn-glycerol-3-phosphate acyltransferases n=1 Tax=Actinopolyspora saharensis TaxID=995062 RepID=A0A1H1DTT3_9ACTN|nr:MULTISPECIES: lysophospholipid acyltransferase family protein [Actinopolyspora]NHD18373.1 1-acyl-sn-glycerol-3-phosphate acyltransferase [Actinopolyspora sp. BKK2]NHE77668.1 1-acyl-sn-glycerol-3-phosphate acyltransferase [Actinopolyspora sp. BKK1]SDQ79326.1 1-acyl-sn-glycerol-3-phosphate acyltransferases [Actinopolyspora saharensis]